VLPVNYQAAKVRCSSDLAAYRGYVFREVTTVG
jgi:hypothetical protein